MTSHDDPPVLAFDGECGFCKRWIERWRGDLEGRVECRPFQDVAHEHPEIPREAFERSIHFLEGTRVSVGAEAVLRALAYVPSKRWMLWLYEHVPGWRPAAELAYRIVARNRRLASRVTTFALGSDLSPSSFELTRRWFLSVLGLVYLVAFASIWSQVEALIGSAGVLPASSLLERAQETLGASAWYELPTLLWFGASDGAIHVLCASGVIASALLAIGMLPRLAAAWSWLAYLSLMSVGDVFLGYQWDALLLETGLLAILLAPACRGPSWAHARVASRTWLWLLRWLLLRLVFLSGAVKLASGDPTWTDCTALEFHYWTQPLPHRLGWLVAQLPSSWHRASCVVMFAIELGLVWLVLAPRRLRFVAAAAIAWLMVLISATGNYGFFNLLTLALCVTLFDDRAIRACLPARWRESSPSVFRSEDVPAWRRGAALALAAVIVTLTGSIALLRLRWIEGLPAPVAAAADAVAPLRSFNNYGLFAVMTTERPEIVIEGSDDGRTWRAYEFRWKPGALDRAPGWAGLHMPRLDWQMWFAALGEWRGNRWYFAFAKRLLESSPEVLAQLATNPFTERAPRQIRSTLYRYRFTTREERARTGEWWSRERVGPYCPTLELVDGELQAVGQ